MSDAQTPQWVILMSTSVSAQGFGVKTRWVMGDVGEVACQPWKVSRFGDAMVQVNGRSSSSYFVPVFSG